MSFPNQVSFVLPTHFFETSNIVLERFCLSFVNYCVLDVHSLHVAFLLMYHFITFVQSRIRASPACSVPCTSYMSADTIALLYYQSL